MNNQVIFQSEQTVANVAVVNVLDIMKAVTSTVRTIISIVSAICRIAWAAVSGIIGLLNTPVEMLSRYYSSVLEREVSVKQTRWLVIAQIAFVVMILPCEAALAFRMFGVALFAGSVWRCSKVI